MTARPKQPSRLLLSFLVFLGVYPLVTLLGYVAQPLLPDWAVWQRNLVVVPIMVLTMVYVLIPMITQFLARTAAGASKTESTQ
jgi:antibiotic biosynthesis monooxygenase (ABM) superfamily enzyme